MLSHLSFLLLIQSLAPFVEELSAIAITWPSWCVLPCLHADAALFWQYSVALGYDEGTALIKIGREEPVASMDSSGKIIWARHNEIQTVNVKSLGADSEDVSTLLLLLLLMLLMLLLLQVLLSNCCCSAGCHHTLTLLT